MANFNINDFKSQVFTKDLARANRFEIQIIPPNFEEQSTPPPGGFDPFAPTSLDELFTDILTQYGVAGAPKVMTLLAEDVMLPGIMLGTKPFRFNNLNEQRAHLIDYMGDSVTFTFLVDTEWSIRNFLEDWTQRIISPDTRYVQYPEKYYSTIHITSLDRGDNEIAGWTLYDAFPRSIAPAQFTSGSPEPVRQPCTFSFTRWKRKTITETATPTTA